MSIGDPDESDLRVTEINLERPLIPHPMHVREAKRIRQERYLGIIMIVLTILGTVLLLIGLWEIISAAVFMGATP